MLMNAMETYSACTHHILARNGKRHIAARVNFYIKSKGGRTRRFDCPDDDRRILFVAVELQKCLVDVSPFCVVKI